MMTFNVRNVGVTGRNEGSTGRNLGSTGRKVGFTGRKVGFNGRNDGVTGRNDWSIGGNGVFRVRKVRFTTPPSAAQRLPADMKRTKTIQRACFISYPSSSFEAFHRHLHKGRIIGSCLRVLFEERHPYYPIRRNVANVLKLRFRLCRKILVRHIAVPPGKVRESAMALPIATFTLYQ